MTPCQLLEQNLPLIKQVIAAVCRQRCLFGEDAEDAQQEVMLRLLADDCAAFADFRGESTLETYITTVTARVCIDEIRRRKGRWRHSAISERLGYPAICLEQLVYRDGVGYEEAVAKLLAEGVVRSRETLDEIWPQLPARPARVFVGEDDAPEPATTEDPEQQAQAREREEYERRRRVALDEIRARFPAEDQILIQRLFYDGRKVAQLAQELGRPQRPLYRRRDKLLKILRRELQKRGFKWPD